MEIVRRKRGRPKKEVLTLADQEDAVIMKWLNFEPMTLDEAALALWMHEGRKTKKPMSKMMILNIERSALAKLKVGLVKYGINKFDDVFGPVGRTACRRYGATSDAE